MLKDTVINAFKLINVNRSNNIDIVLELPFLYATQSADIFAKGAVNILNKVGIDTLVFGTETDNIEMVRKGENYITR